MRPWVPFPVHPKFIPSTAPVQEEPGKKTVRMSSVWKIKPNTKKCESKHRRSRREKNCKTPTAERKGAEEGMGGEEDLEEGWESRRKWAGGRAAGI